MRVLFISLFILSIAAAVTSLVFLKPGYVLLAVGHYSIEMSLLAFTTVSIIIFTFLYFLVRISIRLWHIPTWFSATHLEQRRQRSHRALLSGLIQLTQGNWAQAEKLLIHSVSYNENPILNYLFAAQAAQEQGKPLQRDDYLGKANQAAPGHELAVSLTRAKLQIAKGQLELALATVTRLHQLVPQHTYVLKLLAKLYLKTKDWNQLHRVLPAIRKAKAFDPAELNRFERAVAESLLADASHRQNLKLLHQTWKGLPAYLRNDVRMIHQYSRSLRILDQHKIAETILRNALNESWHETLIVEYGLVALSDPSIQLSHAESWLKNHEQSSMLLLSLARICRRAKLWGKARLYYEASLQMTPLPDTYLDLAELLDQLGDTNSAEECYRKGLKLAVEGIAEPLRTQSEKYAEKNRQTSLTEVVSRQRILPT